MASRRASSVVCECARWGVPRVRQGQDVGIYGGMGGLIVKATRQEHNQKGVLCRCAGAAYKNRWDEVHGQVLFTGSQLVQERGTQGRADMILKFWQHFPNILFWNPPCS